MEQTTLDAVTGPGDFSNIKALGLRDRGIRGSIPRAIGELTELRYLWLSGNSLSGSIPAELFELPNLVEIDLSGNSYSGPIPDGFGTMQSLRRLTLSGNAYTGAVPETILSNTRLTILNLEGNRLGSGRGLPEDIGRMTGLEYLNLSDNTWEAGTMPDLTGMDNLISLSLWCCGLTGGIHGSIFGLGSLQILDLSKNSMSGEIPKGIGSLVGLEYLSLSSNGFTGTVPSALERLVKLRKLDLSDNLLSGLLSDVFGSPALEDISLGGNYWRGTVPRTLTDRYEAGATVNLEGCYLTGDALRSMTDNAGNFADGAATEQYRLIASQDPIQVYRDKPTDIYASLRNRSLLTGNTDRKTLLSPWEYELEYDSAKLEVTVTDGGINARALSDLPLPAGTSIGIWIMGNDGSDYSKVTIKLTTDTVVSTTPGGGSGGGGGSAEPEAQPDLTEIGDEKTPTTDMHQPYINGYPDGTFRAAGQISREEAAAMLIRALGTETSDHSPPTFPDVPGGRWSYAYIEEAASLGIMEGYPNGRFSPQGNMTRAELATVLVRLAERQGTDTADNSGLGTGVAGFSDLDAGAWYYDSVASAAALGYVNGYPDGTFRPNGRVTRAEAVAMTNRMLGRDPSTAAALAAADCPFSDIGAEHWAYMDVLEASLTHPH